MRLRRGKDKAKDRSAPADPTDGEAAGPEMSGADGMGAEVVSDDGEVGAPTEDSRPGDAAVAMAEEAPAPPSPSPPPTAASPPPDGDGDERLPVSFYVEGLYKPDKVPSRDELDRQAEADFRAAIAPALSGLHEAVPEASSPEEAMEELAQRQGELRTDPEGEGLASRDLYRRGPPETAVYYRLRNHFEKPTRRGWRPPPGLAGSERQSPRGGGRRSR